MTTDSVVLITVDCLRADHVGGYGYHRDTTPNIDELASSGVRFKNGYSNGAGTRFAFKSINQGVYPLRLHGTGLPVEYGVTLAEYFSSHGYSTAGFVNNPFLTEYFNYHRGFDTFLDLAYWENEQDTTDSIYNVLNNFARKVSTRLSDGYVRRYLKKIYGSSIKQAESVTGDIGYSDAELVNSVEEWLSETDTQEPFFVWVHFMDSHHPYHYDEGHRTDLGIETEYIRNPPENIEPGTETYEATVDTYDTAVRRVDEQVGRLLSIFPDDISVLLTGDHGEEFGTHNKFHTASPYNSMAWVPMMLSSPKVSSDTSDLPVTHVDIAPTLAEIAGLDNSPSSWDGESMLSYESDERTVYVGFETSNYVWGASIDPPWKLVCKSKPEEESRLLVNFNRNSKELNDLADRNPQIFNHLSDSWDKHFESLMENRIESEHPVWDSDTTLLSVESDIGSTQDPTEVQEDELENIESRLEDLGYK